MLPTMFVCTSEPGTRPVMSSASAMRRFAIPPLFMMLPARMNRGIASRVKDSRPVFIFCMTTKMA